jgi:hypothetical protein
MSRGSKLDARSEYLSALEVQAPDITLKQTRALLFEVHGTLPSAKGPQAQSVRVRRCHRPIIRITC